MDTNAINSIFQEFRKQIKELQEENRKLNEKVDKLEKNLIQMFGYGGVVR